MFVSFAEIKSIFYFIVTFCIVERKTKANSSSINFTGLKIPHQLKKEVHDVLTWWINICVSI